MFTALDYTQVLVFPGFNHGFCALKLTKYLKGITCNVHFPVSELLLNSDWMKCVQIIVKHTDVLYHIALAIKETRHSGQVLQ